MISFLSGAVVNIAKFILKATAIYFAENKLDCDPKKVEQKIDDIKEKISEMKKNK